MKNVKKDKQWNPFLREGEPSFFCFDEITRLVRVQKEEREKASKDLKEKEDEESHENFVQSQHDISLRKQLQYDVKFDNSRSVGQMSIECPLDNERLFEDADYQSGGDLDSNTHKVFTDQRITLGQQQDAEQ